jgi:hypothetical protein
LGVKWVRDSRHGRRRDRRYTGVARLVPLSDILVYSRIEDCHLDAAMDVGFAPKRSDVKTTGSQPLKGRIRLLKVG